MGFEELTQVNVDYNVNDSVKVLVGPLKDFIGTVTEIAKSQTKYAGVKVTTEAPIVKYDIADQTYTVPSAKFYPEGTTVFKKGNSIPIRVNPKNYRSFVPEENGSTAEKILFSCGTFMIIAFCIMYFRYY